MKTDIEALELLLSQEHNIVFISAEYVPGVTPYHKDPFDERCDLCNKLKQIEQILEKRWNLKT